MKQDLFSQERLQELFENDFNTILESDHNKLEYIEQSHYGDLLIEKIKNGNSTFKLWANYDGISITGIEIEYCGELNNYRYETILEL